MKIVPINVHIKFSYSHVPQPHRLMTKLRNVIVNIKIKVLFKFKTSGILCEEFRAKSYENCTDYRECMCPGNSHTHMYVYRTCLNHITS